MNMPTLILFHVQVKYAEQKLYIVIKNVFLICHHLVCDIFVTSHVSTCALFFLSSVVQWVIHLLDYFHLDI